MDKKEFLNNYITLDKENMGKNMLSEITKIGNYVLPVFGAFLTAVFAIGDLGCIEQKYQLIILFALYTILSTFVAYWHRIAWLRRRHKQELREEMPSDLPFLRVLWFMILHLFLIIGLIIFILIFVW